MTTEISALTKISEARVATENGNSYLRKLCQHWAHEFPVKYDERSSPPQLSTAASL